jgi:coenzyme F420-reducing hydrogenase delta subunit
METMEDNFKPEIVAFCCHYCAYAAADLAGSMRLDYPSSIKIVEVPCSGKVDPIYILQALEDGADGVMVAG